jgi:hypothetical protein
VFARLAQPRDSQLNLAECSICCLVGRLGATQHCPPHAKRALSQAEKRSSNRASHLVQADSIPIKHCSWPCAPRPPPAALSPTHFPHPPFQAIFRPSFLLSRRPPLTHLPSPLPPSPPQSPLHSQTCFGQTPVKNNNLVLVSPNRLSSTSSIRSLLVN